uniref:(California timema) hypothetical protein n=1 Tax=Timema californicum TaxID=61474 RepID=A0A7R9IYM2_TIMCA|nr:unnamed protein product [Timema californicum]
MGGQLPAMAELNYLDKVKWLEMYGVDLHPVLRNIVLNPVKIYISTLLSGGSLGGCMVKVVILPLDWTANDGESGFEFRSVYATDMFKLETISHSESSLLFEVQTACDAPSLNFDRLYLSSLSYVSIVLTPHPIVSKNKPSLNPFPPPKCELETGSIHHLVGGSRKLIHLKSRIRRTIPLPPV